MFLELLALAIVRTLVGRGKRQTDRPAEPTLPALTRQIALVGRTGSGKSTLGNRLLRKNVFEASAANGSTQIVQVEPFFKSGWYIADTPGLLDGYELRTKALRQMRKSRCIVYVVDSQMYRQEMEIFGKFLAAEYRSEQKVIGYFSKGDLKTKTMTSSEREQEFRLAKRQFQKLVRDGTSVGVAPFVSSTDELRTAVREVIGDE